MDMGCKRIIPYSRLGGLEAKKLGGWKDRRPGSQKALQLNIHLSKAFELLSAPALENTIIRVYLKNKILLKNKHKYF
jgi:hypothetical protein